MRVVSILLLVLLFGCDAEKRMSRIVKRNPGLIKSDTVWTLDTIYSQGAIKDSTFHFYQTDTVVMEKDNLTVKYFFNHDSTIFIEGKCKPDTILKYYPVQVNTLEVKKALKWSDRAKLFIFNNWWWILGIIYILWWINKKFLHLHVKL